MSFIPLFHALFALKWRFLSTFPPPHSLADDNAKQLVSSEEESKALPAAEDVSGAPAAVSSTPV